MTIDDFTSIITAYGDQDLPEDERWKSIDTIAADGIDHPISFRIPFNENKAYFINDEDIGPGFYIMEELHPGVNIMQNQKICSFIPLDVVLGITFVYGNGSIIADNIIIQGDLDSGTILQGDPDMYDYIIKGTTEVS